MTLTLIDVIAKSNLQRIGCRVGLSEGILPIPLPEADQLEQIGRFDGTRILADIIASVSPTLLSRSRRSEADGWSGLDAVAGPLRLRAELYRALIRLADRPKTAGHAILRSHLFGGGLLLKCFAWHEGSLHAAVQLGPFVLFCFDGRLGLSELKAVEVRPVTPADAVAALKKAGAVLSVNNARPDIAAILPILAGPDAQSTTLTGIFSSTFLRRVPGPDAEVVRIDTTDLRQLIALLTQEDRLHSTTSAIDAALDVLDQVEPSTQDSYLNSLFQLAAPMFGESGQVTSAGNTKPRLGALNTAFSNLAYWQIIIRNRLLSIFIRRTEKERDVKKFGRIHMRRFAIPPYDAAAIGQVLTSSTAYARRYGFRLWLTGSALSRQDPNDFDLILTKAGALEDVNFAHLRNVAAYIQHEGLARHGLPIDVSLYPNLYEELPTALPFWLDAAAFRQRGHHETIVVDVGAALKLNDEILSDISAEERLAFDVYAQSVASPSGKHVGLIEAGGDYDHPVELIQNAELNTAPSEYFWLRRPEAALQTKSRKAAR
ncbi:MAG: hypothetical protein AAF429_04930 [Pseudomonadota bacterium]